MPLLLTRYGAVPHLTHDTLKHVSVVDHVPLLVPYQHHVKQIKVLEKYGHGLARSGVVTGFLADNRLSFAD